MNCSENGLSVRAFGTENRQAEEFFPGVQNIYECVEFNAGDVQNLSIVGECRTVEIRVGGCRTVEIRSGCRCQMRRFSSETTRPRHPKQ